MCYTHGAVETYVSTCPMCKVFPHPRCPHQREVCRNRAVHPRLDVLYMKNAEVDLFNGCGYCKWAKTNPPAKATGMNNLGYPGCCRAPSSNEYRMIRPTDWKAVNIVHHVPIPPEVKTMLDRLSPPAATSRSSSNSKPQSPKPSTPPLDRKTSGNVPQSKTSGSSSKSTSPSIPLKGRSGGSPASSNAGSGSSGSPSTSPRVAPSFDVHALRDALPLSSDRKERRIDPHSSPARRSIDIDSSDTTPRKNSVSRQPSNSTPSRGSGEIKRKASTAEVGRTNTSTSNGTRPKTATSGPSERAGQVPSSRATPKAPPSESSSSSSGTGSDSTITSDGGFTDYLSDESEQELQRQAEARAALLAQSQAEEMEFKAARQRLVGVDLSPDEHWRGTNITNNTLAPRHTQTTSAATKQKVRV